MRVYTSYFANWRKFPEGAVPIAVCRGVPHWFQGKVCYTLAPDWKTVQGMRCSATRKQFVIRYCAYLNTLVKSMVLQELAELSEGKDVVLLCYEKPTDFCHRHLIADWLGFNWKKIEV